MGWSSDNKEAEDENALDQAGAKRKKERKKANQTRPNQVTRRCPRRVQPEEEKKRRRRSTHSIIEIKAGGVAHRCCYHHRHGPFYNKPLKGHIPSHSYRDVTLLPLAFPCLEIAPLIQLAPCLSLSLPLPHNVYARTVDPTCGPHAGRQGLQNAAAFLFRLSSLFSNLPTQHLRRFLAALHVKGWVARSRS